MEKIAALIGAREEHLPTVEYSRDIGFSHIEFKGGKYHLVSVERGKEVKRKSTTYLDEFLYMIFSNVTFEMAIEFEVSNRVAGQDSRILLFAKQIQLMRSISPEFGERIEKTIPRIVKKELQLTPVTFAT